MIFSEQDPTFKTLLSLSLRGTGFANGVEERLTYTSTTANDNAGRPPSYRHYNLPPDPLEPRLYKALHR